MTQLQLSPLFSSQRDDWQTPHKLFNQWNREFRFTIDAAASDLNKMLPRYWTKDDNALLQNWMGERVWCNPPYGQDQVSFIEKAAALEADIAVLLLPTRTDKAVWHTHIFPKSEVRFIRGRIRFVGAKNPAPFPSALTIWRKK